MLKIENLDEKNWLEWQMTFSKDFKAYWTEDGIRNRIRGWEMKIVP